MWRGSSARPLAGMLIAVSNEGWCFLIDGISYMAVIASLLMMHVHTPTVKARSYLHAARAEGGLDVCLAVLCPSVPFCRCSRWSA